MHTLWHSNQPTSKTFINFLISSMESFMFIHIFASSVISVFLLQYNVVGTTTVFPSRSCVCSSGWIKFNGILKEIHLKSNNIRLKMLRGVSINNNFAVYCKLIMYEMNCSIFYNSPLLPTHISSGGKWWKKNYGVYMANKAPIISIINWCQWNLYPRDPDREEKFPRSVMWGRALSTICWMMQ